MTDRGYFGAGLWRIDLALARHYSLGRAYRISLRERPREGPGAGVGSAYGETPLKTMRRVMTLTGAGPTDTFMDLGSGTGRFAMFAYRLYGVDSIGVEWVPSFVRNAQRIADRLALRCRFVDQNMFEVDWSEATLLYVITTAFTDEGMALLSEKCDEIQPGARLVTVTRRADHPALVVDAVEVLDYSWGASSVFVQRRT